MTVYLSDILGISDLTCRSASRPSADSLADFLCGEEGLEGAFDGVAAHARVRVLCDQPCDARQDAITDRRKFEPNIAIVPKQAIWKCAETI
jgi:hypothetical protein